MLDGLLVCAHSVRAIVYSMVSLCVPFLCPDCLFCSAMRKRWAQVECTHIQLCALCPPVQTIYSNNSRRHNNKYARTNNDAISICFDVSILPCLLHRTHLINCVHTTHGLCVCVRPYQRRPKHLNINKYVCAGWGTLTENNPNKCSNRYADNWSFRSVVATAVHCICFSGMNEKLVDYKETVRYGFLVSVSIISFPWRFRWMKFPIVCKTLTKLPFFICLSLSLTLFFNGRN